MEIVNVGEAGKEKLEQGKQIPEEREGDIFQWLGEMGIVERKN